LKQRVPFWGAHFFGPREKSMMEKATASDGHVLDYWVEPAIGAPKGGLVIIQEIFGVTEQLKGVAKRYAGLGFNVAIPALFDRQEKGAVIPFSEGPRGRDLMLAAKLEETMMDIDAAVSLLHKKGGKVAAMGFCWGGGLAIRAAQKSEVACSVSFYGTRLPQYLDAPLKAPVLGLFGKNDDHVPLEMIKQASDYLIDFEVHLYDAGHAFANDARPSYVAEAAEDGHKRAVEFLESNLK
jgi:carboxymethylenebutenolidase